MWRASSKSVDEGGSVPRSAVHGGHLAELLREPRLLRLAALDRRLHGGELRAQKSLLGVEALLEPVDLVLVARLLLVGRLDPLVEVAVLLRERVEQFAELLRHTVDAAGAEQLPHRH